MILLKANDKQMIKSGNTQVLKRVLESKLDAVKDSLIERPVEQLETLRGEARLLKDILELL